MIWDQESTKKACAQAYLTQSHENYDFIGLSCFLRIVCFQRGNMKIAQENIEIIKNSFLSPSEM